MKVVTSILERCDTSNIKNNYNITYMYKFNESLNINGDLTFHSHDENDINNEIKTNRLLQSNSLIDEHDAINNLSPKTDIERYKNNVAELPSVNICESLPEATPNEIAIITENNNARSCDNSYQTAEDSGLESAASSWDKSVIEVKEHAFSKLEQELQHAREILKLRDEEVMRLSSIRQDVETELQDLTASLFQEAHKMVREANLKQAAAEKALKESSMKVDVLTAEVAALKTLVLTSTPSQPNLHLHCQSQTKIKEDTSIVPSNGGFLKKQHHRSPSHYELKYGRDTSPIQMCQLTTENFDQISQNKSLEVKDGYEIDPNIHKEFITWKNNPSLEKNNPFITRMYTEDIDQCLNFNNTALTEKVKKAVESDNIYVEAVDKSKSNFPKNCSLMEMPRLCYYRMKIADSDDWHYISQVCRNRIIAVCNFLNYLRYIQRGLVKCSVDDMYWEIVRLRKEMIFAKLGLPLSSLTF